jgi:hypothetical protein
MSDNGNKDNKMDPRCPRALEVLPNEWCPLAVMRLRAIRTAGRELTEDEESKLPGCPWAVNHQLANYCFFKYIKDFAGDKPPSDMEIASLNCISVDAVKKAEKSALTKIRETDQFQELKESLNGESIITEQDDGGNYKVRK